MRALNSVILVGAVGADPVFRQDTNGNLCCELSLSSQQPVHTPEGPQSRTEWVRIRLAHRLADFCRRDVRRGALLAVEGAIRSHMGTGPHGRIRREVYVQAERLHLLAPHFEAPYLQQQKHDRRGERTHPAFRRGVVAALVPNDPPDAAA